MIFEETPLQGAWLVTPEPARDERGFFARMWCAEDFAAHGIEVRFEQISTSLNARAGTLRGLHLQRPPHAETKLVRATAGAVFDVIVDLRSGSPSYGRWFGVELSANNHRQILIPEGFAHGFQSLTDGAELAYHIAPAYAPGFMDGVRFDDADLAIAWPLEARIVSERDSALKSLAEFAPC